MLLFHTLKTLYKKTHLFLKALARKRKTEKGMEQKICPSLGREGEFLVLWNSVFSVFINKKGNVKGPQKLMVVLLHTPH